MHSSQYAEDLPRPGNFNAHYPEQLGAQKMLSQARSVWERAVYLLQVLSTVQAASLIVGSTLPSVEILPI